MHRDLITLILHLSSNWCCWLNISPINKLLEPEQVKLQHVEFEHLWYVLHNVSL